MDESTIDNWLNCAETENLEFKAAQNNYDSDKLINYIAALANENGGHLVLGITNDMPRKVVGTNAFINHNDIKMKVYNALGIRVELKEINYQEKRILVFSAPSRPIGTPIGNSGYYPMRIGENLVGMSSDQLKKYMTKVKKHFLKDLLLM